MVSPGDSQKADLIDTQTQIRGHHLLQIATTILVVLMLTACGKRIGARTEGRRGAASFRVNGFLEMTVRQPCPWRTSNP